MPSLPIERASRAVFVLLMLATSWFALMPSSGREPALGWDKADHLVSFAALMLAMRPAWPKLAALPAALLLSGWGGAIELIQTQVPGRHGSWADVIADLLGVVIGLLLYQLVAAWRPLRTR